MDKSDDNYHGIKTQYFSLGDILALGLMIATGLYFIITSSMKLADLFFGSINSVDLLLNLMGAGAGYGLIYGAYRFVTKSNILKSIADGLFVEAIYDRLEPLLVDIAQISASYDTLSERVDNLNYNVNDIRKSIESGKRQTENDLIPIQYVLWWALITSHSNLWELTKAWYWVAIPILIVPLYSILFSALSTANTMLFIMYIGLGLYVISYYMWSEHTTRGILPFGIGERIQNLKNMLRSEATEQKKEPEEKTIIFYPYQIGTILTILSIIVFAIAVIGYLIQAKILPFSWQTLGLDFNWQPMYSYGLVGLGTVLLISGYFFVIKFRRRE